MGVMKRTVATPLRGTVLQSLKNNNPIHAHYYCVYSHPVIVEHIIFQCDVVPEGRQQSTTKALSKYRQNNSGLLGRERERSTQIPIWTNKFKKWGRVLTSKKKKKKKKKKKNI
jgi:hypothetical protein